MQFHGTGNFEGPPATRKSDRLTEWRKGILPAVKFNLSSLRAMGISVRSSRSCLRSPWSATSTSGHLSLFRDLVHNYRCVLPASCPVSHEGDPVVAISLHSVSRDRRQLLLGILFLVLGFGNGCGISGNMSPNRLSGESSSASPPPPPEQGNSCFAIPVFAAGAGLILLVFWDPAGKSP